MAPMVGCDEVRPWIEAVLLTEKAESVRIQNCIVGVLNQFEVQSGREATR